MKKFLTAVVLSLVTLAMFTGCEQKQEPAPPAPDAPEAPAAPDAPTAPETP